MTDKVGLGMHVYASTKHMPHMLMHASILSGRYQEIYKAESKFRLRGKVFCLEFLGAITNNC